ncbi:BspA family leucine-rich repeat surface protein [Companilactobacillus insicii]|uniref:BspA family leucine-rich repeat surface protein n=1 Tax=Companilactobacillus insicii TaxID=1732567 RepID=UPI0013DDAFAA|nr:BspA family leucine-rich repeat surface protein [Companilactobacillus insicii]
MQRGLNYRIIYMCQIVLGTLISVSLILCGQFLVARADTSSDMQQVLNQNATATMGDVKNNNIMPLAVSESTITHSGVDGTANWDIDSDGLLTIHAGVLASGIGNWSTYSNLVKKVYVDPGVAYPNVTTDLSDAGLFSGLSNVTSIDATNLDVSNAHSLYQMFRMDFDLKEIIGLDKWDTANVSNMSGMFANDSSLTSLNLSHFDTSSVDNMSSMFYRDNSLTSINLSNFDTSRVTSMMSMFAECTSLVDLDVSSFNTAGVGNMSFMFEGVGGTINGLDHFITSKVSDLSYTFSRVDFTKTDPEDIAFWDTSQVGNMNFTFEGATFNSLNLSSWNFSQVGSMSHMFADSIGNIDQIKGIADWNISIVTDMSSMFQGASTNSLTSIANWDVSKVTNMSSMFSNCSNLASLDLSNWHTPSLEGVDGMFSGAKLLDENNLKGYQTLVTNKVQNMSNMFASTHFGTIDLSKYDTSKVKSFNGLFYGDTNLKRIIGDKIDTSSLKDMSSMFSGAGNAASDFHDISNWDTSQVENMQAAFRGSYITNFDFLKNWNVSNVKNLDSTFSDVSAESLPISSWNVSNVTNMNSTFAGTIVLNDLPIQDWNVSNVTDMQSAFSGSGLENLNLGNWNTEKVSSFYRVFNNMQSLESIDLSHFDTTAAKNIQSMFGGNPDLWKITLGPKTVLNDGVSLHDPKSGTAINDESTSDRYSAISDKWQEVDPANGGTDHNPVGDLMSISNIISKFSTTGNPVTTYVWQQHTKINMKMSVPDIDFGVATKYSGLVTRKGDLSVNIENNSYPTDSIPSKLEVSMEKPLTDVLDSSKVLSNVLVYKGKNNIEKILSPTDTEVYSGDINNGSNVISWDSGHGILLDMNNDKQAEDGNYSTVLTWTLTNSI